MIKCICIDDKNKPEKVSDANWPVFGKEYTVKGIFPLVQPGAIMGVTLQEIGLSTKESSYKCYKIGRFGFKQEDLHALAELIANCKEFNGYDPLKLIESEILTGKRLDDFDDYLKQDGEDKPLDSL